MPLGEKYTSNVPTYFRLHDTVVLPSSLKTKDETRKKSVKFENE